MVGLLGMEAQAQFNELDPSERKRYEGLPRAVTTAVPIMLVSPDSRAGGMGDVGVASTPDAYSNYWNPAKLAFLEDGTNTLALSYTPWLNKLVNDINLAYISYATKIDERQGLGISMRYFSLGDIQFKDNDGNDNGTGSPYEFALNAAYSLQLSEQFAMAVGLRYIFSDLTQGNRLNSGIDTKPGQSFAADVGMYYQSQERRIEGGMRQQFTAGLNIQNIGGKISYGNDAQSDFIPTNLRLGGGYHLQFDEYNRLSFMVDVNKLLVPTPPIREGQGGFDPDYNNNGVPNEVLAGEDDDVTSFQGIFQSFGDAPGGFDEELEEVVLNIGAEFWYDERFAFRGGYQYEDEQKGGRKYFTMGLGFRANVFGLDFAYLIPASQVVRSPLENTLRFSLLFDFEKFAEQ